MDRLNEYILSALEERNKIFSEVQSSVNIEMTVDIFKANSITHGLNFILDYYEKNNIPTDFIPETFKEERQKYKFLVTKFNTPEVQEQIKPILQKLQNEKKL